MIRRVLHAPGGMTGLILVALVLGTAAFAPLVAPYDPEKLDVLARFARPSAAHWLGTDEVGRDVWSRLVWGGRVAMEVAVLAIASALLVGGGLGVLAALMRRAERPVLAIFDVVASFPSLVLALAAVAVVGPGTGLTVLVVALTLVPQFGRVARVQALALREADFVQAARALGAAPPRVLLRHIVPNLAGPLLVLAGMEVPGAVTVEAGMSFLGLGVQPPFASWGTLISDGYSYLSESPWPALAACGALAVATLGFTLLGEALRDALALREA